MNTTTMEPEVIHANVTGGMPHPTPPYHLDLFSKRYQNIHGYVAAIICVFGIIGNILNFIVLTRKTMLSSTNVLLAALAVTDGLTMVFYFAYALQNYIIYGIESTPERDTIDSARFTFVYAIVSLTLHAISIWLTVTLALFRYIFIRYPRQGTELCTIYRAKVAIVAVVLVTTIMCTPNSASYVIKSEENDTLYFVGMKMETSVDTFLSIFNFWLQAIFIRLVPCFWLTVLSILLIRAMQDVEKNRKRLMARMCTSENSGGRERKTNRTTRMLLAVVILFLITEIPQGILTILSGTIDNFFMQYYTPLGDLQDILALINNGINFILYCTMSKQFRDTFFKIFFKNFLKYEGRQLLPTTTITKETDV